MEKFFKPSVFSSLTDKDGMVFIRKAFILALPIILQRLLSVFVNLIDNIMVGSMGDVIVSACSIANQFTLLYMLVTSGIVGGAVIISAQAYGKGDKTIIKKMMSISLIATIINSLIFFLLAQYFAEIIIKIYSNQETVLAPASQYLRIISYSFPFFAISTSLTMMLSAIRNVKIGFFVEGSSIVIKSIFNYVFIFGSLGFPKLGLEGAAIATVLARVFGFLIATIFVIFFEKKLHYQVKDILSIPNKKLMSTYINCGFPVLVGNTFMMVNSTFQTMITGRISSSYITANSIVHVIWQVAVLAGMGLETAAGIMIGNDIGNGDMENVQKDGERFFVLSIGLGIFASIIVLILGPLLLPLYNISEEALRMAQSMIISASIVVFIMVIQMIITKGVIRAGGRTKQLMIMDLLSCFCFGLPLGYLAAFVFRWPPFMIYIVIRGDYLVKAVWGFAKLKSKNWALGLVS